MRTEFVKTAADADAERVGRAKAESATYAVAVVTTACLLGWFVVSSRAVEVTPSQFRLIIGATGCALVAGATAVLVGRLTQVTVVAGRGLVFALPLTVFAVITSVFENGIGPVLPHQVAWAIVVVVFVVMTVAQQRDSAPITAPGWLLAYAGLGFAAIATLPQAGGRTFLDVGLSVAALFVMWQVALHLARDGGLMRLLGLAATLYWSLTLAAIVVEYSGIAVGSFSPSSVTLPWQVSLSNIFVDGNVQGYGFVHGQAGREVTFIVCLYHFVAFRYAMRGDTRIVHGLLAVAAFLFFLTCYGRIPFAGALIGLAIAVCTTRRGTNLLQLATLIAATGAVVHTAGLLDQMLALREGATRTDTGHTALWVQHLNLFALDPISGVGGSATYDQIVRGAISPVFPSVTDMPLTELVRRGSRGEGGWTGLLAQRGLVLGGIVIGLLVLAGRFGASRFPSGPKAQQDMIIVRAVIPASFVFYITDVVPMGVYTFTTLLIGQVTMIAVVKGIAINAIPLSVDEKKTRPPASPDLAPAVQSA